MQTLPVYIENNIDSAVLYILRYYAIFKYPLTIEEIHNNCPIRCEMELIEKSLIVMEADCLVFEYNGYYTISHDVMSLVCRREIANKLAKQHIIKAKKAAKFIYMFPFVKFVGISGSLSKGYADETTDYDFFIVTQYNRLWICRTILHLFKKLTFLAGQQHKFCMNYFIDSENLEIEEKNIFTSIELSSLIPVCGTAIYSGIIKNNNWLYQYIPNAYLRLNARKQVTDNATALKGITEFILSVLYPEKLNEWLMKVTDKRWKKKWFLRNYPEEDYWLAFKTTLHHSKNHPANYQKKILERLGRS